MKRSWQESSLWILLKTTFEEWNADNATRLAAALAYYTIFSVAPLLVIVVAGAGLFYGREAAQGQLASGIERYITNPDAAELIQTAVENARVPQTSLFATIIGFGLLLWGATGVFNELRNSLNNIWDVPIQIERGIWGVILNRLLTLLMVIISGALLLLSLLVSTVLAAATDWINTYLPGMVVQTQVINFAFLFLVTLILFALIYKFVPDVRVAWRDVWAGAVATALLFSLGRLLIGWYLAYSTIASAYGAASSLALILLYTYYSAQVFFLGAEFTQVYSRTYGSRRAEHQLIEQPIPAMPQQTEVLSDGKIVSAVVNSQIPEPATSAGATDSGAPNVEPGRQSRIRRAAGTVMHNLAQPAAQAGAALGVMALLSVVNLVTGPIRRQTGDQTPAARGQQSKRVRSAAKQEPT